MESNGIVSNKLLKLTWRKPTRPIVENIQALKEYKIQIQNPVENNTLIFSKEVKTIKIMDLNGRLIFEQNNVNSEILKVIDLEKSVYFIMIDNRSIKKIITYD
jgi:hypothetical protein